MEKKTREIGGLEFEIKEVNEQMRIALLPEISTKYEQSDCGKKFIEVMSGYAQEIAQLPIKYRKPPVFSFVVLPQGEIYQSMTRCPFPKGMCGIKVPLDDIYKTSLAVDEIWFSQGFLGQPNLEKKIGLIHELSHTVHSSYFQRMGCLGEGFAELVPHYLMAIENSKHDEMIKALDVKNLPKLSLLNKEGMFSNAEDKKLPAQYRTSYLSVYLWMLGYIKRLEKGRNVSKYEAVNILLEEFSKFDKLEWSERISGVCRLIGESEERLFSSHILQKEGQEEY